jgi:Protein of unknown function (DUF3106)
MRCQAAGRFTARATSTLGALLCGVLLANTGLAQQPPAAEDPAASEPLIAAPQPASVPASAPPKPAKTKAPTPEAALEWQALSATQKQLLAPLESEWAGLSPSLKGKWLELAARYHTLPMDEQARVQERLSAWAKLSPTERQQARLAFQAAKTLKADERQAKWDAYQALSPERRRELADKAAGREAVKLQAGAGRPALVPLLPSQNVGDEAAPLGPVILQARPGATTVLINQGNKLQSTRQPSSRARIALDLGRLDSHTLLPKTATP